MKVSFLPKTKTGLWGVILTAVFAILMAIKIVAFLPIPIPALKSGLTLSRQSGSFIRTIHPDRESRLSLIADSVYFACFRTCHAYEAVGSVNFMPGFPLFDSRGGACP